jgi:hypothetical protein
MELDLTTPALLFPGVAILMLGYINRYVATAAVIRTYAKDYDSGYKHINVAKQLKILQRRIALSRLMLASASVALLLACLSMFLLFERYTIGGEAVFALALVFMITSIGFSLWETGLSNRSLMIEVNDVLKKEKAKKD